MVLRLLRLGGEGGGDSDWDIQTDYLKYLPPTSMQVNALYLILTYPSPCLQYNAKHLFFFPLSRTCSPYKAVCIVDLCT